jgi:hypothetical protein
VKERHPLRKRFALVDFFDLDTARICLISRWRSASLAIAKPGNGAKAATLTSAIAVAAFAGEHKDEFKLICGWSGSRSLSAISGLIRNGVQ